jgi:hypothetical protein
VRRVNDRPAVPLRARIRLEPGFEPLLARGPPLVIQHRPAGDPVQPQAIVRRTRHDVHPAPYHGEDLRYDVRRFVEAADHAPRHVGVDLLIAALIKMLEALQRPGGDVSLPHYPPPEF